MYASLHDKSLQSCLTLCDLMDCGLPISSLHQSLQASLLKGAVTPSSRGPSLRTASLLFFDIVYLAISGLSCCVWARRCCVQASL